MARENTPDLLESMFAKPAPERKQQTPKTSPETTKKSVPKKRTARAARAKVATPPPSLEPPIRSTHYVSRETSSRMAAAQGTLLGQTAMKKRELSNSNLVEAALRMALSDLEKNGVSSEFVTILQEIAASTKTQ